ncbi:hypothetical protein [Saccharopolyspora gregorii]|uniref:hypothetical protein n=1 Tax=Saccharopolyspora gregorii TaxID=33914 RepID=UPI0021AC2303|nr:hypothetical protein [Saccharopolyspora gregorii]
MNQDGRWCVTLSGDRAVEALRDTNEFVVSLDRILSRIGAGGEDPRLLVDYVVDRNVLRRLAELRATLGDALEDVLGADSVDEIAESAYRYGSR